MGLFTTLLNKILFHAPAAASAPAASAPSGTGAATAAVATPVVAISGVDITAILEGLAAKNAEKLDWKHSIVDLMKLVGMDSSFSARKELATELHYTGDKNDSANLNIWLHSAVIKKIAENGGKVPQELLS